MSRVITAKLASQANDSVASPSVAFAEQMRDPERIRETVQSLVRHRAPAVLASSGATFPIAPVELGESIKWDVGGTIVSPPFEVRLTGHNSVFSFSVECASQQGSHLLTEIPAAIHVLRQRCERRHRLRSAMRFSFPHPATGSLVTGRIRDISFHGIGIVPDSDTHLPKGVPISSVQIHKNDGSIVQLDCEVRIGPDGKASTKCYGLRVLDVVGATSAWFTLVSDSLYPNTQVGSSWLERVWCLYQRSGYFHLSGKAPEDFAITKPAFLRVGEILDHAPHLGVHAVWPSANGAEVVAAYTGLKVYSRTWMTFQLAKIKGPAESGLHGGAILREVHARVLEHAQQDPALRWVMVYAQDQPTWSRYVYRDIPRKRMDPESVHLLRFTAAEVSTSATLCDGAPARVSEATSEDLDQLCGRILALRGAAYADALDLTRSTVALEETQRQWRSSQLARDRIVLVARRNGQARAAGVLELGAEGAHLYGLIDLVRLYALADGGAAEFDCLIDAATRWYKRQGCPRFVALVEDEVYARKLTGRAGVRNLGVAHMLILAAERVPEWLERLHEVTAPRQPRTV